MALNNLNLISIVNFLLNFAIESSLIFIPLFGAQLGASDFQVGLIGAAYGSAFLLFSIYSGRQSDKKGRLPFVHVGLFLAIITFALQLLAHGIYSLMAARAAVGLALGITMAALVAYAYDSGSDMGKFSSYGSLGWIAGAVAASLFKEFNLLFIISIITCAAAFGFSLLFPHAPARTSPSEKKAPKFGTIIRQGFPIYLAVFLRHLGAVAVWLVLPLYFAGLGFGRFWVGALWVINFIVQFIVMRYMERFDPAKLFAFGQVLSIFVFSAYVIFNKLWPLMIVQLFLGVAWSCLYVGALLLVLRTGEDRGTASGIFQATLNLCAAIGPFLGGLIAEYFGYQGVMIFAALLGVAGMLVTIPQGSRGKKGAA